jgi:hypothetical protein
LDGGADASYTPSPKLPEAQEPTMASKRKTGTDAANGKSSSRKRATDSVRPAAPEIATPDETVQASTETPAVTTTEVTADPTPPTDEVRRRAYAYWVAGNPDPVANWFRAENDLRAENGHGQGENRA